MSEKELTVAQRSVLLTLMIKAEPVPNQFFRNSGISLDKAKRDELVERRFITVTGKPLVLDLTEKGWGEAAQELGAQTPARAGALGGTLYLLLDFLRGYFERNALSAAEFFARAAAPEPVGADVENRIRKAYAELARRSGDYVMLDELRGALAGATRSSVDAALLRLDREPDVHLVPESNQKVLTGAQRAAAIHIGNQDMHLIAIGS